MIEEQLFNKHFVGRDGFVWWVGQIVDQTKWQDNITGRRVETSSSIPGFGERYKVRIMGYHTHNLKDLSDDELPWATVMYPVTAGAGGAGASTSCQLRQGNFVFGFFIDGEDAQQPVIMGVLGFNQQTSLEKKIPDTGFLPFSGYTSADKVPVTNIQTSEEKKSAVQTKSPGTTKTPQKGVIDDPQGATAGLKDLASAEQLKDGKIQTPMAQLTRCGSNDSKGISADITKVITTIENLTKLAGDFSTELTGRIDKIQKRIQSVISDATNLVASKVKNIVEGIRKTVMEKINNTVKDTFYLFFPNKRPEVKEAHNKALEGLGCAFNKIIGGLLGLVGDMLQSLVGSVINAPLCLAENITSNLLGQVGGFISGAINSILNPINSLLSTVGAAVNLSGSIFSLLKKVFGLFNCEENLSCPSLDQWSIWDGPGDNGGPAANIDSIFQQAESIGSAAVQAATDLTGAFNPNNFSFNLNASNIVDETSCDTGPFECGAPTVSFFGSAGSNTVGNVIVGVAGEILGVDLVSSGSGYISEPSVSITDSCGTGDGASAEAIMTPASSGVGVTNVTTGLGVAKIVIIDPGNTYISYPTGAEGGSGRVWKQPNQSYVKTADGKYQTPVNPGTVINLKVGDTVKLPAAVGKIPANIKYKVTEPISITAPEPAPRPQVLPTYPVILELDEVFVKDTGFNYQDGDTIVMTPNNGAVLTPVIKNGAIIKVNIEKGASGFDTRPKIYVESNTGFNAELIPVFKVKDVNINDPIPPGTKVISVVDCVGKVGQNYK